MMSVSPLPDWDPKSDAVLRDQNGDVTLVNTLGAEAFEKPAALRLTYAETQWAMRQSTKGVNSTCCSNRVSSSGKESSLRPALGDKSSAVLHLKTPAMANFGKDQRAAPFELMDLGGRVHRLGDYAGRWLLLVFHRHLA
jgi:hypothetical protein